MQLLTITGAIDGANDTFTISPVSTDIKLFWNGVLHNPNLSYSLIEEILQLNLGSIPQKGDDLLAFGN